MMPIDWILGTTGSNPPDHTPATRNGTRLQGNPSDWKFWEIAGERIRSGLRFRLIQIQGDPGTVQIRGVAGIRNGIRFRGDSGSGCGLRLILGSGDYTGGYSRLPG